MSGSASFESSRSLGMHSWLVPRRLPLHRRGIWRCDKAPVIKLPTMPLGFSSVWNSAAAAGSVSRPQLGLDAHVRGIQEACEHSCLTRLLRSGRFQIHKRLGGIAVAEVDGSANVGSH